MRDTVPLGELADAGMPTPAPSGVSGPGGAYRSFGAVLPRLPPPSFSRGPGIAVGTRSHRRQESRLGLSAAAPVRKP